MSKPELIHIFDNSTCLTKKQIRDYVGGKMTNEEAHAVEVHLNSCPLCSDAVEGLYEQQEGALAGVHELSSDFLKDRFGLSNPQVHLNTIAAAHAHKRQVNAVKSKTRPMPAWRATSIAAGFLLLVALLWYYNISRDKTVTPQRLAQQQAHEPPGVIAPVEAPHNNAIAMNEVVRPSPAPKNVNETELRPAVAQQTTTAAVAETTTHALMVPAIPLQNADRQTEELTVSAYKAPLADKNETKPVAAEDAEKMQARSVPDVAASQPVAQKSFGNSYDGAGITNNGHLSNTAKDKTKARIEAAYAPDRLEQAYKLYMRGSYGDALNVYTKEMQNSDYTRKAEATLGAARCYIALGNRSKARALLQPLVDEGSGAAKRQAKRLLKDME